MSAILSRPKCVKKGIGIGDWGTPHAQVTSILTISLLQLKFDAKSHRYNLGSGYQGTISI